MNTRSALVFGLVGAFLVACGGSIAPDLGASSSSGASGSGSSSSGASGSGSSSSGGSSGASSSSSGGSSGTSGGSSGSSGSSGGTCVEGTLGDLCPWDCPYGPRARCIGGKWSCPTPTPSCDVCTGPIPDCFCGAATCDSASQKWTCSGCADAGGPFACGKLVCVAGQICTDTPPGIIIADSGPPQDFFNCAPIPPACAASPSCACVVPALKNSGGGCIPSACNDDGAGHVTVNCIGI